MIAIGVVPAAMIGVAIGAAFLAIAGTVLSSLVRLGRRRHAGA
jgi:hypothetical protein